MNGELPADAKIGGGIKGDLAPFLNRDISWVDFNERVLEEGLRGDLPLMERLRFLAIVSSNFDEFFMVRVAAIKRALDAGSAGDPSGLSPAQQLKKIAEKTRSIINRQYECLRKEIIPGLAASGLTMVKPDFYSVPQMDYLEAFFMKKIYPILTPLRIENDKPLPFMESRAIYAAFLLVPETAEKGMSLQDVAAVAAGAPAGTAAIAAAIAAEPPGGGLKRGVSQDEVSDDDEHDRKRFVIVELPKGIDRIIWLPNEKSAGAAEAADSGEGAAGGAAAGAKEKFQWALLDDVALIWGAYLFQGYRIEESLLFKINRDADFSVDEKRDEDFIEAMEEVLEGRGKAQVVRMICSQAAAPKIKNELARQFMLEAGDIYEVNGAINLWDLLELAKITGFEELMEAPWKVQHSTAFGGDMPIWERISQGDVELHFPYQSFNPVVRFFEEAAADPDVIAIKATLYRAGGAIPGAASPPAGGGAAGAGSRSAFSPVVRALEQAALNGKHVTAVVELKARFDEERNISWAHRLEKAGVIVVYGLANLKVHAKLALVLRRENDSVKRYVHLSTGNYNDITAKLYEDVCLFTCREDIAFDAGLLFNMLTGYSAIQSMARLAIAPLTLKGRLLELIERETTRAKQKYQGHIMAKLNAVTDTDIIKALYRASEAGVKIYLCVRGICTLIPGLPVISENIHVISVIDHYLEHSRICVFANGGEQELYLLSADWMPRSLERRVELMFPVQDEKIRASLTEGLSGYFRDNCQARVLNSDGTWTRLKPGPGEKPFRIQKELLSISGAEDEASLPVKQEFVVRRSPAASP